MKNFKKTKTVQQIAKKHNASVEEILKQLAMGKKVEKEHTTNAQIARMIALHHLEELPNYYSKLKKVEMKEDLRNWFNPKHPDGGWKRINSKGKAVGPCARKPGEPKPKCMSNKKRSQLTQKERAAAVAVKRKHDPVADRKGKGGKPVNVSNFGKGRISESVQKLFEKNKPINPELWARAKAAAKSKFDVYPSAYANGWAAKWYKSKGGGWKSVKEAVEKIKAKRFIREMAQRDKESTEDYRKRLLDRVLRDDLADMDVHDRVHGALAYADHLSREYGRSIPVIGRVMLKGAEQHAQGLKITGIDRKGKTLTGNVVGAGGSPARHGTPVEHPLTALTGLHVGRYADIKPEHTDRLKRLLNFRGRPMKESIIADMLQVIMEAKKSKKPYKGFKKGKNHPEGGLSRAEARRQGIHAGIETKDEAERKGGFGKLSKKTQGRRKSFCGRMCGMKRKRTSAKTARDPKSKINAALRVWGCRCEEACQECDKTMLGEEMAVGGNFATGQVGKDVNPNLAGYDPIMSFQPKMMAMPDVITPTPNTMKSVKNAIKIFKRKKLAEKVLTPAEMDVKEKRVKELKKHIGGFKLRYGPRAKNIIYAIATRDAKKMANEAYRATEARKRLVIDAGMDAFAAKDLKKENRARALYNLMFPQRDREVALAFDIMPKGEESTFRQPTDVELKDFLNRNRKKPMSEEIVNASNAGTMTRGEIRKRDKTASKVKARPIKGDTEEESKHRIATFITLRARGKKKKK